MYSIRDIKCFCRGLPSLRITRTGKMWVLILITLGLIEMGRSSPRSIRIGGLFEPENEGQDLVLKYAISKINQRRDILPRTSLTYTLETVPAQDSFTSSKKVCQQMGEGVAAIFGPMSRVSAAHVQSVCDTMEVPHIETLLDFKEDHERFSINLHPYFKTLAQAYVDFVLYYGWTRFTILYDSNEGLVKLQDLLKAASQYDLKVTVRRLDAVYSLNHGEDYRPLLKELELKDETRIILDCDISKVKTVLHQALTVRMVTSLHAYFITSLASGELGMTSQYYHYHLVTLDVGLIDLEDYKHDGCNITAFQLVQPTNTKVMDVTSEWIYSQVKTGESPMMGDMGIKTDVALMYDAMFLFAKAIDEYTNVQDIAVTPLSCSSARKWHDGEGIINFMKTTTIDGLTGMVKFDNAGRRSEFSLDLIQLTKEGLQKRGTWDSTRDKRLNITVDYAKEKEQVEETLQNRTLIVTTILEDPYMMRKDDPDGVLQGNDRFEGYCVDLLDEIAKMRNFKYSIKLVDDNEYGAPTGDGEWTGMVKELMDKTADLAVASLTISYVREQVIDFTKPYMNLGISILFKRPEKKDPSLFSFLAPLSLEIWAYVVAAYLGVSFMLFVLARFSPYEWYNPHPCNPDSDVVENQFSLNNSLWFTIGSLMQQGCEVMPKAISTRMVSGLWWFFTLIIISSYTANLAAFLTVERMTSPIENADDLSKQTSIKYGTVIGGSTKTFFQNSKIQTYERMWNFMISLKPSVFVNSTKDGIKRVKEGDYAYLLENTMNEYITQRDCSLMQVGGLLDSKGYGIGTPRGSPFRDTLSEAILKLQEDQVLQVLYNKWWKQKGVTGKCDTDEKKNANALEVANVGGVFVLLVAGLVVSVVVALLEFCWNARKNADEDRQSLCSEMIEELRFAVRCFGPSTKTHKKKGKQMGVNSSPLDGPNGTLTPLNTDYGNNHIKNQYGIPEQYT